MLEFYLGAERPAFAEVVAQIDHSVRNIEAPVRGIVLVELGTGVSEHIITVKIAAVGGLAVAADTEAIALDVLPYTVRCGIVLRGTGHTEAKGKQPESAVS